MKLQNHNRHKHTLTLYTEFFFQQMNNVTEGWPTLALLKRAFIIKKHWRWFHRACGRVLSPGAASMAATVHFPVPDILQNCASFAPSTSTPHQLNIFCNMPSNCQTIFTDQGNNIKYIFHRLGITFVSTENVWLIFKWWVISFGSSCRLYITVYAV
jgi:hypothetical protein